MVTAGCSCGEVAAGRGPVPWKAGACTPLTAFPSGRVNKATFGEEGEAELPQVGRSVRTTERTTVLGATFIARRQLRRRVHAAAWLQPFGPKGEGTASGDDWQARAGPCLSCPRHLRRERCLTLLPTEPRRLPRGQSCEAAAVTGAAGLRLLPVRAGGPAYRNLSYRYCTTQLCFRCRACLRPSES